MLSISSGLDTWRSNSTISIEWDDIDIGSTAGYNAPLPDAFGSVDQDGHWESEEGPPPKPLVELEMTRLSAELRRKPSWWVKCHDEIALNRWREEALAQSVLMDETHIDYVLKELDGYANLRDEESGAEVSCYDKIWQSDTLVPAPLKDELIAGAAKLENLPEQEKDWRPRSNRQVLNLVHPSLYPIVYGQTMSYLEGSEDRSPDSLKVRLEPPESEQYHGAAAEHAEDYYLSKRFQWLPTDFKISDDGKSVKRISYINNINSLKHGELYESIEGLIAAFIPLFERVLTDCIPANQSKVIPARTHNGYRYNDNGPDDALRGCEDDYDNAYRKWEESRPIVLPGIREGGYRAGRLERRIFRYSLGGRTIQLFIELSNIHLTPDNSRYEGESWHIEGMKNEAIAACGIYYYGEENVTESRLEFRTAVAAPKHYEQNDERGCKLTWGMGRGDPCVNELGSVIACRDRCIVFPNIYQHRLPPFELADKSKPGYRKTIFLYLIDPAVNRPSTTTVPPQQAEWRVTGIKANPVLKAAFNKLSPEIIDHINSMAGKTMTREEAEAYRLELMDERATFVARNNNDFFLASFSL